jgi:hypothetical protein
MVSGIEPRAFYSLLRWCSDPARNEARNVAVIVVHSKGEWGAVRAAPISTISPRLAEQGIVDAMVDGLQQRIERERGFGLEELEQLRGHFERSISLTEPRPVVVSNLDATVGALYRALVARPAGGSRAVTKSVVLDRVVAGLRRANVRVGRSQYVGDVLFDLVFEGQDALGEVLSFASGARNVVPIENDAGHFLFGLSRIRRTGIAVVEPPPEDAPAHVADSHARVLSWFGSAGVPIHRPEDFTQRVPQQQILDLIPA